MSSSSLPQSFRGSAPPTSRIRPPAPASHTTLTAWGFSDLLVHLTLEIARGRALDAIGLIDRLLAGDIDRHDSTIASDLRILRDVAELELARQRTEPPRSLSNDERTNGGTVATMVAFADRILPALQRLPDPSLLEGERNRRNLVPSNAAALPRLLSERELDVLQLVATGMSNRAIAQTLFIAEGTVKKHLSNVLAKLGARSRTQAVAVARCHGLLA